MSTRYHIDGQWVTSDYIKKLYRSSFSRAGEIFYQYLGVYMPFELNEIKIRLVPMIRIRTVSKIDILKIPEIKHDVKIPFKAEISLRSDLSSSGMDLDYFLKTTAAHEFADPSYTIIRGKLFGLDIDDEKQSIFLRLMKESFAEVFQTLYCNVNGLDYKRPSKEMKTPEIYKVAHYFSNKHKNASLRFRARLLQALLFQKPEPIKKVEEAFENEWKRAEKYAKG